MPKIKKGKKKAGAQPQRQPQQRAAVRLRAQRAMTEPDVDTSAIEAHINPFSDHAREARIPDQGSGRTLTEQVFLTYAPTSDASGGLAVGFQASPRYPYMLGTLGAGDITWPAAWTASTGTFATDLNEARVVSWGIRVFTTLSATNAQGRIQLAKAGRLDVTAVMPIAVNTFSDSQFHPLAHGAEFTIVPHPTGAEYQDFRDFVADANTVTVPNNWEYVVVIVRGMPATTAGIFFEIVMNMEEIVDSGEALFALTKRQPVFNPQLMVAIDHVRTAHNGLFRGLRDAVHRELKTHAVRAAKKHLPGLLRKGAALLSL